VWVAGVEHWMAEGADKLTEVSQTPNTVNLTSSGVRRRAIRFVVERETAQTAS
jgi:hypothetical protein